MEFQIMQCESSLRTKPVSRGVKKDMPDFLSEERFLNLAYLFNANKPSFFARYLNREKLGL